MFKKFIKAFNFYKKADEAFGDIFDAEMAVQGLSGKDEERARKQYIASQLAIAPRRLTIIEESKEIMKTTINPVTFWGRYGDIMSAVGLITFSAPEGGVIDAAAAVMKKRLEAELEPLVMDFIDRCLERGKEAALLESLKKHEEKITPAIRAYLEEQLGAGTED